VRGDNVLFECIIGRMELFPEVIRQQDLDEEEWEIEKEERRIRE
jgi:hypothetical protein